MSQSSGRESYAFLYSLLALDLGKRTVSARPGTALAGAPGYDYVDLTFVTTPEPTSGRELLQLNYSRPDRNSPFALHTVYFYTKGNLSTVYEYGGTAGTLVLATSKSFSGTFTAQARPTGNGTSAPYTAITDGIFTDVD